MSLFDFLHFVDDIVELDPDDVLEDEIPDTAPTLRDLEIMPDRGRRA